jgi:signal transduction histidine kinase
MVIFLGLLSYMMVEYKVFRVKVLGTQILVAILWILVGAVLFVAQSDLTKIIVAATEIVLIIFGIILIRSVKKEVRQREQIEDLARQLKTANDNLTAANVKLKDLDRQKTEFLSIASHQLRSPLTAIKGYASMLLEGSFGEMGEKVKGAVDVVYQSSQKLIVVIEDFLNITRIELGRMKYDFVPTDLKELMESVVRQMLPIAESHKLKLTFAAGKGSYALTADAGKLTQVFTNLIDNAIKYTPEGSIEVKMSKEGKKNLIKIKDTGVGIDAETKERLFQKFSRAFDAGKTNASGTGLGLYVAKQLVEAHSGTLSVESPGPGKGSTFIVEIPEKAEKK